MTVDATDPPGRPDLAEVAARANLPVNLARLDLKSLKLVVQCAALGSISGAAKVCNLSVMGASDRLRRLEETLERPLFYRYPDGVRLTESGAMVVAGASGVFATIAKMLADVADSERAMAAYQANPGRRKKADASRAGLSAPGSSTGNPAPARSADC